MTIGICDGLVSPPGGGGGGGSGLTVAAAWTDLPTAGTEGDSAYLTDAQILVRWSADADPLDAAGRRWIPDPIYSDATGTGVVAGVVEWLEPIDVASVGDGNPVATWPSRAGTGDYTAAGTARPTFDADGGADGGAAVVFDGADDYMAKSGGLDILAARRAYAIAALARPDSLGGLGMIWTASMTSNTTRCGLYRQTSAHLWLLDTAGGNAAFDALTLQPPVAASWRLAAGLWAAYRAVLPRGPSEADTVVDVATPSPPAGNSAYIRIGAWRDGAEPTVTDPYAGRIGTVIVLASSTAGGVQPGAARAVAAWLSSRAGLL
jgi:hypothetical protein